MESMNRPPKAPPRPIVGSFHRSATAAEIAGGEHCGQCQWFWLRLFKSGSSERRLPFCRLCRLKTAPNDTCVFVQPRPAESSAQTFDRS
jgi:hypothetical protein